MLTMLERLMERGGPVMWPLAVMSLLALTIALREAGRFVFFSRSFDAERMYGILVILSSGDRTIPRGLPKGVDPVTRWYDKRLKSLEASPIKALSPEDIGDTGLLALSILATITAAAPLLGILGTVLGIIQSFSALSDAAAIQEVSAGISQALVSTAAGLVVSMCSILPHNLLAVLHSRWTHATAVWARRLEQTLAASGRVS